MRERFGMFAMLLSIILVVGTVTYVTAQNIQPKAGQLNNLVVMLPGAVPTSNTCLVGAGSGCLLKTTATPYVCEADFTGTGQTITMQDGQVTPVIWIVGGGALGAMGAPVGWSWNASRDSECRIFPYGVYLVAGSGGATGSVTIKY